MSGYGTISGVYGSCARKMLSIDLFAGCGGLSSGLDNAGFTCVWANEFDKQASDTFQNNFPMAEVCSDDIRTLNASSIRSRLGISKGKLALVAGGFPCQGFSTYGQRKADDDRNQLYIEFMDFVEEFQPQSVLIENVVGMLSMLDGQVVSDICYRLERLGYSAQVHTLQSADFGVPQLRKRVFVIGTREGRSFNLPNVTHFDVPLKTTDGKRVRRYVSVGDAISDLPRNALKPNQAHDEIDYPAVDRHSRYARKMRKNSRKLVHHSAKQLMSVRKLRIILMKQGEYGKDLSGIDPSQEVPKSVIGEIVEDCGLRRPLEMCRKQDRQKEADLRRIVSQDKVYFADLIDFIGSGGFANKYRRLNGKRPAHTLVAHMARDCSDFIHPTENRFITVREAARLQSFPDNFRFSGSQFAQLKQIGNAVPPMLACEVGKAAKASLLS